MLNSFAEFLQDRSVAASTVYGFLFIFYYALLVALSLLLIVRFRLRGILMALIIVVYALTNITGDSLSESIERVRMAQNNSVFRIGLVIAWFGILFSCILTASLKMGRRKP